MNFPPTVCVQVFVFTSGRAHFSCFFFRLLLFYQLTDIQLLSFIEAINFHRKCLSVSTPIISSH